MFVYKKKCKNKYDTDRVELSQIKTHNKKNHDFYEIQHFSLNKILEYEIFFQVLLGIFYHVSSPYYCTYIITQSLFMWKIISGNNICYGILWEFHRCLLVIKCIFV